MNLTDLIHVYRFKEAASWIPNEIFFFSPLLQQGSLQNLWVEVFTQGSGGYQQMYKSFVTF